LLACGAAAGIGIAAVANLAVAQSPWQDSPLMRSFSDNWSSTPSNSLGTLASNDGIYVDVKEFKISKGAAKGDPASQIAKMGAREVADGAIIFRSGNKLYIVDGRPPATTQ
jgi:hypothetical protein